MKSGRRTFLQFASLAPATAAAGFVASSAAQAPAPGVPLTRGAFAPLVGEEFAFETSALEKTTARLVGVEPLAFRTATQGADDAFRLVFETSAGSSLAQQTFPVSHPRLGRFALFVSPNDAEGHVVEAIFNRI